MTDSASSDSAMLQRLDDSPITPQHWKILLPSGMGFFTDAYDLFIIGVVATMLTSEWHIASYPNCSCLRRLCCPRQWLRSSSATSPTGWLAFQVLTGPPSVTARAVAWSYGQRERD